LDREKQLPLDEAVRIAVAAANALSYAHQHGVIHRDLKPENILLQHGQPVIADFGIALAVSNAGGQRVTQTGLSLGTPQYMSPEQATGDRSIDGRIDIFSLGAVLYEMLTGEPPHTANTAQAIIARLMTERPRPVRAVRDTVPEYIELAIDVALAKLPADRFSTAADFALALQGDARVLPTAAVRHVSASSVAAAKRRPTMLLRVIPWIVAAAAIVVAAFAWTRPTPRGRATRFVMVLPDSARLMEVIGGVRIALSRDGAQLAYVAGTRGFGTVGFGVLYIRALDDTVSRIVRGTERGTSPVFSPDGSRLAFLANGKLMTVSTTGGTPAALADSVSGTSDWTEQNEIFFTRVGTGELWRVSGDGGVPVRIAGPDRAHGIGFLASPHVLPGGKAILVTTFAEVPASTTARLAIVTLPGGVITDLKQPGTSARYSNGYIVFGRDGSMHAAPFSLRSLRMTGPAVPFISGVNLRSGAGLEFALANDGTMAYVAGALGVASQLVAVDRQGAERRVIQKAGLYSWPRLSPDGKRIAVEIGVGTGVFDVWLFDIASQAQSRLTNNFSGVRPLGWSADGTRVGYLAVEGGGTSVVKRRVAWVPWDVSGPPEPITEVLSPANIEDASVGPAHGYVAIRLKGYTQPGDIVIAPLDSVSAVRSFAATSADEETPRLSPDGKLLAYASDETGTYEVYVRPVSGPGPRVLISAGGGSEPVWTRDGRGLYYRGPERMMFATLTTGSPIGVAKRDTLFLDTYRKEFKAVQYDVFPSGQELLMMKLESQSGGRPTIVVNWPALLKRRGSSDRQ
jgi:serine/threonine-protein kinase